MPSKKQTINVVLKDTTNVVPEPRRLRRVGFTPAVLCALCSGIYRVEADPLPEDVEIRGAYYDSDLDTICLVVESNSFDLIDPGCRIPFHTSPKITKLEVEDDS
jgi:hypothetical protein